MLLAQQARHVAVRIVEIAEVQRIGDAGIDACRGRARVLSRDEAVGEAEIDAVGAERAFLCDADALRLLARELAFCRAVAVGELRRVDLEARLIGARYIAVGAPDADIVIDGDDAVGPPARGGGRADMHARRVGAVLAADGNEGAADVGIVAHLDVEHAAPLHRGRGRVRMAAGRRAGLTADAAFKIGDHHPTGHGAPPNRVTLTFTRSALDPVASVRSSNIGVSAFMLGACRSLAKGVAQ